MYYVEQNKTGGGHFLGWTQKSQSGCRKVVPRAGNEQWKWGQHPQQGHQTCCAPTVQTDTLKGIIFLLPLCVCVYMSVFVCSTERPLGSIVSVALACISPSAHISIKGSSHPDAVTDVYISPRWRQISCCPVCKIRLPSEFILTI